MAKILIIVGCLFAMLGVALGAFAAHGLKSHLSPSSLSVFQTGVYYQFLHALALLLVALAGVHFSLRGFYFAGGFFIAGIVLFCGSLYALSLGGPGWLGPITPLGGASFIVGWAIAAITAFKIV